MQFSQDFHPFVVAVFLDQIPWTLREPDQSHQQEDGWYDLEAQWEAPLERTRVGCVPGTVAHPGRYDEPNTCIELEVGTTSFYCSLTYHLLCETDDHSSDIWMSALCLVDWHTHGHESHSPSSYDSSD
jgi:hypothetical protein